MCYICCASRLRRLRLRMIFPAMTPLMPTTRNAAQITPPTISYLSLIHSTPSQNGPSGSLTLYINESNWIIPMVTAIPILKLVNNMEWNSLVILGPLLPPPGETYSKVISAPSVVSKSAHLKNRARPIKHIPHVNTRGKSRSNQNEVPFVASIDAIPNNATSVLVSNPNPNRNPKGYIFQGRSINLNNLLKILVILPPIC